VRSVLGTLLALSALVFAACGSKDVDTATYTCGEFNKSLRTKGDDTAGNYINQLVEQAKLGQDKKTERREVTLGIIAACRGKPAATKPAQDAITGAKALKARAAKKKSTN
jgi:hypothetical protein